MIMMSEEMLMTALVIMWFVSAEQFTKITLVKERHMNSIGKSYSHLEEPASNGQRVDTKQRTTRSASPRIRRPHIRLQA